ncbi:MAG: ferrous iron transport protein [Clostridia bacterium]|nr:ferrous iron transport protein [Clostridia bacterium]
MTKIQELYRLAGELGDGRKEELQERIVKAIYRQAEAISGRVVSRHPGWACDWDRRIDDVVTSRLTGFPLMLLLLGVVFWVTIVGANYPSEILAALLFGLEDPLSFLFDYTGAPQWLCGMAVQGVYRTVAWVVSVMLPPMAIFFPCFTLLEDLGYLPRAAFNLDGLFKRAGTQGKQGLTMCMGFGCNAAGVTACRIIDSPRERLIAILTNNFVPCNGRFPTLIALATLFFAGSLSTSLSFMATAVVTTLVLLGVTVTLLVSYLLSKTLLRGLPSSFVLELPPYRMPQVGRVIVRSIFDRTIFVLGRAVTIAAPAGAVIWLLANNSIGGQNILKGMANFLDLPARFLGLDGYILTAFILGLPANEIVLPILLMGYLAQGTLVEPANFQDLGNLLVAYGWTPVTAFCFMLFSLLHYPCGTTIWTIYKETKSFKWTIAGVLIPLAVAVIVCGLVNFVGRLILN